MQEIASGVEGSTTWADAASHRILGLLSLALAFISCASIGVALVLATVSRHSSDSVKNPLVLASGFVLMGGGFLSFVGLVFGALGIRGRKTREISAVIGTVVCGCILISCLAIVLFGLVVQHRKG